MVVRLSVGDQIRTTQIRFRKTTDFEAYINDIAKGYDAEDAVFNGYVFNINTPQFNLVDRSQYGKGKGNIELKIFNGYVQNNKKQVPQYLHFTYGDTHLKCMKKIGNFFKLQKEVVKTEMVHDEKDGDIYLKKKNELMDFVKQEVLCTSFSYARFNKATEEITGFSTKAVYQQRGWVWRYFHKMRDEIDEAIYTYNAKYIRVFVRRSMKGRRVCALINNINRKLVGLF